MEKQLKKLGAYSILVSMLSGLVFAGVEWDNVKTRVELHERKLEKIDVLFKLNCKLAIELIKDKKTVTQICVDQLE